MIIICPIGSFKKRAEKWVKYKDFAIADATARHDGCTSEYGNRIETDELSPTPTLTKIALDPEDKESQIKKRHLANYIDRWLNDEAITIRLHYFVKTIVESYEKTGEDFNFFVLLTKPMYYAYQKCLVDHINELFGETVAVGVTHKMDKGEVKKILSDPKERDYFKTLKKSAKKIQKSSGFEPAKDSITFD